VPLALAALVTLLEGIRGPSGGGLLAAVLALAGVAASRGFSMSLRNLLAQSREAGGAFFGFAGSAALLLEGRGLVLAWRTGGGLPMRGAGALLGGAFLLCLLGSLLLAATFLSRESLERARLLGERALILAFGLLALGAGLKTALLASRFPEALPAEGRSLSLLWGGVMALAFGVLCLLGEGPLEPAPSGDREIRIAAALAGACLLGAGLSSWLSQGTSWGGAVPLLLSTAILGLGARAFGWGALLRRGAFLAALLYALA
jgi:hypothetical protein